MALTRDRSLLLMIISEWTIYHNPTSSDSMFVSFFIVIFFAFSNLLSTRITIRSLMHASSCPTYLSMFFFFFVFFFFSFQTPPVLTAERLKTTQPKWPRAWSKLNNPQTKTTQLTLQHRIFSNLLLVLVKQIVYK